MTAPGGTTAPSEAPPGTKATRGDWTGKQRRGSRIEGPYRAAVAFVLCAS